MSLSKVAVITGHYIPELGYQEVNIARTLARQKYEVKVFTTGKIPKNYRNKYLPPKYLNVIEKDADYGFDIIRMPVLISLGNWVYSKQLKNHVWLFSPDLIIIIAVGKLFPLPVLKKQKNRKIVTFIGNNSDFFNWHSFPAIVSSLTDKLKNLLIRNKLYKKAISVSDLVVIYTPETQAILESFLPVRLKDQLKDKIHVSSVGFDPDEFYFEEKYYINLRDELKIPVDSCIIVTATRMNENKRIEQIIESLEQISMDHVYYLIIGFQGDYYESRFRNFISKQKYHDHIICMPLMSTSNLRKYYSFADFGIWIKPAISIQQSMGTGLKVLLENKPSLNHLVKEDMNGWYFDKENLREKLNHAISEILHKNINERIKQKDEIMNFNRRYFSYDVIMEKIIDKVKN